MSIPKIIHYCWFGSGKLSKLNKRCISSWKKILPDYKLVEWNESNFDININTYVKEAYEAKKFAFVTDYVRYYIINKHGGIYMDTDVMLIKPIDKLIKYELILGFEKNSGVNAGIIISNSNSKLIDQILSSYEDRSFITNTGEYNYKTIVDYTTEILVDNGLELNGQFQELECATIFPQDYFSPMDYYTGKLTITDNTYAIHFFAGSWHSSSDKIKTRIRQKFGIKILKILSKIKRVVTFDWSMKR